MVSNSDPAYLAPLPMASIEITRRCQEDCPYCHQVKEKKDMPLKEFQLLVSSLKQDGFKAIALGGGEPTLHPEILKLLEVAKENYLLTGLTTNSHSPLLIKELLREGLLHHVGISAGKGHWLDLVSLPEATVNLLLLHQGLETILKQALQAIEKRGESLLLLSYKGDNPSLSPTINELQMAYSLLATLKRKKGVAIATDDYIRRKLKLTTICGQGFVRIAIDGRRDPCCFPSCEYRDKGTAQDDCKEKGEI